MQVAKKHLQDGMLLRESEIRQFFRRPKMLICEFVVQLFLIKAGLFSSHAKPPKLVGNPRLPLYTQREGFFWGLHWEDPSHHSRIWRNEWSKSQIWTSDGCRNRLSYATCGMASRMGVVGRSSRVLWRFCWTRAVAFLYSKLI